MGFLQDLQQTLDGLRTQFSVSDSIISAPIGGMIALWLLLSAGYLTHTQGELYYVLIAATIGCYTIMIDGAITMNRQLKHSGRASANQFAVLVVGSVVVLINSLLIIYELSLLSEFGFPVLAVINMGIYIYLLLNIILYGISQDKILVKPDPTSDSIKQYVFTEETYIPLLEKSSLEKSTRNDDS